MFDFAQQLSTRLRRLVAPAPRPAGRDADAPSRIPVSLDDVGHLVRLAMPNAEHGTCHVGAYAPSLRPTVYWRRGDASRGNATPGAREMDLTLHIDSDLVS